MAQVGVLSMGWRRGVGVVLGGAALLCGFGAAVAGLLEVEGLAGRLGAVSAGLSGVCGAGWCALALTWPRAASAPARVWEALRDLAGGRTADLRSLRLDPDLGEEASAWNRVVCEREQLERLLEVRRAEESVGSAGLSGGEGLDGAFGMLPMGVVVVGADGRIEYANAAAGLSLSAEHEGLVGVTPGEAGLGEGACGFIEEMRTGSRRQRGSYEQREETEEGVVGTVLRLSARPVKRGGGGRLYVTVEDVTQQRMADEARNALIASATHELRTPLTNVRLYIEELIDAGVEDEETRLHAVNVISKEARRLERIVTDLLSVAELESGSMRLNIDDVRLGDLMGELEGDFRQQAQSKGIDLRFDLPPRVPMLRGDPDRFELVLYNLVGNALKYTPEGGRVDVRVEEAEGMVEVAVSDTGIGIDPSEVERVFDRFYRASDGRVGEIEGTGLGLTIAREIARRHGGDIGVDSEPGKGSVFTLRVPVGGVRAAA